MSKQIMSTMSDAELISRFAACGVQQDIGLLGKGTAWFNRHYDIMHNIRVELGRRPGDRRLLLLALFDHPNMQVRVQAAKATLAVAPLEARRQLEAIVASKWFPQAGDAGMCLLGLDDGTFKPI